VGCDVHHGTPCTFVLGMSRYVELVDAPVEYVVETLLFCLITFLAQGT
jgi:hypothetical protein